jgi:DNA-binding winged helix-turn-helix (wHTH) protein
LFADRIWIGAAVTTWFGDYVLDEARRELLHLGAPVHLTPKAFEVLRLLLERRPAALSKGEIHDRIWPGTFVSDVNLATLVFEIRSALGDDPRQPRYIRTVRGFGYAFCDWVAQSTASPAIPVAGLACARLIWGPREISLREGENILGRAPEAVLWLDHGSISRRHARLTYRAGLARLEDLGSRHGTFVDGVRIELPTAIQDGTRIRLGTVDLLFRILQPVETDSRPE